MQVSGVRQGLEGLRQQVLSCAKHRSDSGAPQSPVPPRLQGREGARLVAVGAAGGAHMFKQSDVGFQ
jgi:hypothetical protein